MERSTTHAITNQTIFSSPELSGELLELIDPRHSIPKALLPTFLHEATHHWCFTSTVGTVIAVLAMRGRINALRAVEAQSPQAAKALELRAADDLTRAEIALQLLRPLAEGLATFAEFDLAASQRSPVVPPPLRWAMAFVKRDQLTGTPDTRVRRRMELAQFTTIELTLARQSERARAAKEALLVHPLSCRDGEGYLAGYLMVKALWRYMKNRHERFLEPELFMLKIYDLFYEDFAFARILLDQSQTIPAILDPLTQYLNRRLQDAFKISKDSLNEFFEARAAERSRLYKDETVDGRVLPHAESTDNNPSTRFRAIWEVVMGAPASDLREFESPSQMMEGACHMVGYGRDLLELGRVPAELTVTETETLVQVDGQVRARLATVDKAFVGETGGTVHILLNTRNGEHIVAAISPQWHLIALQKTAETAKSDDVSTTRSVKGLMAGPNLVEVVIRQEQERLNSLRELTRLNGYLQQSRDRLDIMYGPPALIYVPEDKLEELLRKMTTDGVYGAFDGNADLVRAVAVIGSTAHFSWMPEHLKSEFEKNGLDYEALMSQLHEFARSTNLFMLSEEFGIRCSL